MRPLLIALAFLFALSIEVPPAAAADEGTKLLDKFHEANRHVITHGSITQAEAERIQRDNPQAYNWSNGWYPLPTKPLKVKPISFSRPGYVCGPTGCYSVASAPVAKRSSACSSSQCGVARGGFLRRLLGK
jgi:hypothetical protein